MKAKLDYLANLLESIGIESTEDKLAYLSRQTDRNILQIDQLTDSECATLIQQLERERHGMSAGSAA